MNENELKERAKEIAEDIVRREFKELSGIARYYTIEAYKYRKQMNWMMYHMFIERATMFDVLIKKEKALTVAMRRTRRIYLRKARKLAKEKGIEVEEAFEELYEELVKFRVYVSEFLDELIRKRTKELIDQLIRELELSKPLLEIFKYK